MKTRVRRRRVALRPVVVLPGGKRYISSRPLRRGRDRRAPRRQEIHLAGRRGEDGIVVLPGGKRYISPAAEERTGRDRRAPRRQEIHLAGR